MPGSYRHLYIHIPFCSSICHYCHFYTVRAKGASQEEFFGALGKQLERELDQLAPRLDAVYFGGGTPAASPPALIERFLSGLAPRIGCETELTLEANPTDVSEERIRHWAGAGVNRLSIGVQSLNPVLLRKMGRAHSVQQGLDALELGLRHFDNVSCDLMFAVPGQREEEPAGHALELAERGASHISAYHFSVSPSHFLHPQLPGDGHAWQQLQRLAGVLEAEGFRHYEVASFARPGRESRNNRNYWFGGPYLAFGPSAHGFDGERRRWSLVSDWKEYVRRVEAGECPRAWTEELSPEQLRMEVLLTRLRTAEGLDLHDFERRFSEKLLSTRGDLLRQWQKEGLATLADGHFALSFSGKMLADEIVRKLL